MARKSFIRMIADIIKKYRLELPNPLKGGDHGFDNMSDRVAYEGERINHTETPEYKAE